MSRLRYTPACEPDTNPSRDIVIHGLRLNGSFYPRGTKPSDYLAFYAERFQTVEIDSTSYAWRLTRTWPDFAVTVP